MTTPQQRYEQIAADLVRRVRAGEFPPGTRLPSNTTLGREYRVSSSVIDKATALLRRARWYQTLPGRSKVIADPLPPPGDPVTVALGLEGPPVEEG